MRLRFTLTHAIEGSKVISEPDGWKDATIGFERHADFHSLVEFFKSSFMSYGSNGTEDGGRDWVLNIEKTYGVDEDIELLVEIDPNDTDEYEAIYTGQISLNLLVESLDEDHMAQLVFTQKSFWTKFVSRFQNKVNIKSILSESGEAVTAASEIDLPLPSQVITATYERKADPELLSFTQGFGLTTGYCIFDAKPSLDELETVIDYGIQISSELPTDVSKYFYKAKYGGVHDVDISIRYNFTLSGVAIFDIRWYYAIRQNGALSMPVQIGTTHTGTLFSIPDDGAKVASFTITLNPDDEIYIWGVIGLSASADITYFADYDTDLGAPFVPVFTECKIVGQTIFKDSTTKAFLSHNVMDAIVERITDQPDLFYSEYLGNAYTSRVYGSEGCGSLLANAKGLHIRGYDLSAKPFFMSAQEWWQGINPIHNLGLGYEKLSEVDVIRVERKEHFYDDSATSVLLSNVRKIKRSYDPDHQFNQIEIGYEKWQSQAESGTGTPSGIDDPQTKRTFNSRFKKVGKKLAILSKWVAASLTLETTRRVGNLKSANYTYDDETFVIALKSNGDGTFAPELDENFTTLTNLSNSDTRYNSRLTPGRNLLRWLNYISGCLQSYLSSTFKFSSGEGNFDMTSQMDTSCLGDDTLVNEKGNFSIGTDFLFLPMAYEIEHYLTWEQYVSIRESKNLAIGVSQTATDHKKMFIKNLDYKPATGEMRAKLWAKERLDIDTTDFTADTPSGYESGYDEPYYE
jgi:hypothetical protein